MRTHDQRYWTALLLTALAASLVRYAGISLIIAGTIITLWDYRADLRQAVKRAAAFGGLSFLPLLLWALFHNLPADGTLFGERTAAVPAENIGITWGKISSWFAPPDFFETDTPLLIFVVLVVVALFANRRADWSSAGQRAASPAVLPSAIFFVAYLGVLIFQTSRHFRFVGLDRVHVAILPSLMLLVFVSLDQLLAKAGSKFSTAIRQSAVLIVLVSLMLFPIINFAAHAFAISKSGDVYYNILNTPGLHGSGVVEFVRALELADNEVMYSNSEAAAWFYLRRPIAQLPHVEDGERPDWPPAGERGYLIWFHGALDYRETIARPEVPFERGWLQLVFESSQGDVYQLAR
jgi:hypothetical protein